MLPMNELNNPSITSFTLKITSNCRAHTRNAFQFGGTENRAEFFVFFFSLIFVIATLSSILFLLDLLFKGTVWLNVIFTIIFYIIYIYYAICFFSALTRRFRDIGIKPYVASLYFLATLYFVVVAIWMNRADSYHDSLAFIFKFFALPTVWVIYTLITLSIFIICILPTGYAKEYVDENHPLSCIFDKHFIYYQSTNPHSNNKTEDLNQKLNHASKVIHQTIKYLEYEEQWANNHYSSLEDAIKSIENNQDIEKILKNHMSHRNQTRHEIMKEFIDENGAYNFQNITTNIPHPEDSIHSSQYLTPQPTLHSKNHPSMKRRTKFNELDPTKDLIDHRVTPVSEPTTEHKHIVKNPHTRHKIYDEILVNKCSSNITTCDDYESNNKNSAEHNSVETLKSLEEEKITKSQQAKKVKLTMTEEFQSDLHLKPENLVEKTEVQNEELIEHAINSVFDDVKNTEIQEQILQRHLEEEKELYNPQVSQIHHNKDIKTECSHSTNEDSSFDKSHQLIEDDKTPMQSVFDDVTNEDIREELIHRHKNAVEELIHPEVIQIYKHDHNQSSSEEQTQHVHDERVQANSIFDSVSNENIEQELDMRTKEVEQELQNPDSVQIHQSHSHSNSSTHLNDSLQPATVFDDVTNTEIKEKLAKLSTEIATELNDPSSVQIHHSSHNNTNIEGLEDSVFDDVSNEDINKELVTRKNNTIEEIQDPTIDQISTYTEQLDVEQDTNSQKKLTTKRRTRKNKNN